jgi:hypothetical protein
MTAPRVSYEDSRSDYLTTMQVKSHESGRIAVTTTDVAASVSFPPILDTPRQSLIDPWQTFASPVTVERKVRHMIELSIALSTILILSFASVRADERFRGEDRLPMQWSAKGNVNWTAPRRIALAFTPVLAIVVLTAVTLSIALGDDPRPGQDSFVTPAVLFIGLVFIGVHALHLRLIARSVGKAP